MNKLLLIILAVVLFSACSEKPVFETQKLFKDGVWLEKNPVIFEFEIADTSTFYNLDLFINHSQEYTYQNIYLNIITEFPKSKTAENLIPINFADRFGKWYGKCSGNDCKLRVFLKQNFKFKEAGNYKITIEQKSRDAGLKNIDQISAALYLAEKTGK